MPIAVFGAETPEVIALRLLTAIWPSYRRRFTVSTFCNSPRSISKRSFDLVFAPVDARSRFSDWKGRRVDGRRSAAARHRWSTSIVDRVFRAVRPSLRGLDVLGEMARDERGSEDVLRVSLLWDELHRRVGSEPQAVLGLLDIANTRAARSRELVRNLEPALAQAATTALTTMPAGEAWRFLQILTGKLGDTRLRLSVAKSIRSSAISLARQHPLEALEALPVFLREDKRGILLGALGNGLAGSLSGDVIHSLAGLAPPGLLRLLIASPSLAEAALDRDIGLDAALAADLRDADPDARAGARRRLLRHMVHNRHIDAFRILVSGMTGKELVDEVARLNAANGLRSDGLDRVIVAEAKRAGSTILLRDLVVSIARSPAVDAMLGELVGLTPADVVWVIEQPQIEDDRRRSLLLHLIDAAPEDQLQPMFSGPGLVPKMLRFLGDLDAAAAETLSRIAEHVTMDPSNLVDLVVRILPSLSGERAVDLAVCGLEAGLGRELGASRDAAMSVLLETTGKYLDGARVIRVGMSSNVPLDLASRNLILFDRSPPTVRERFLRVPEVLVDAITGRHVLDLSYEAAEAAARLLWDSDAIDHRAFVNASATLLPFAMRERRRPASALIAAAFPPVYRELQQERLPEILSYIFLFLDWDRCRSARRALADAFSNSEWRATDIALAAARTGDAEHILKHVAKHEKGLEAIAAIEREIDDVPPPWRQKVLQAIMELAKRGDD